MPEYKVLIVVEGEDRASGALGNVGHTLGGLGGIAGSIVGVLGGAGVALAGLGAAGVAMNADFEQTFQAFSTLLGSADQATAFLDELRAFSASTPFEFPELAGAARKLLAFGFAAEDIVPMMTNIGDAVGALGGGQAEIDRVTMALGQMRAKGKVSAEEMMQLAELGVPAWQMLADSMGLSVAQVMDLASKGQLAADQAIPALLSGMQQTFGGAMQQQATTFNGLLSTLADNAKLALQTFTGPIFTAAKGGMEGLAAVVASPAFGEFAANAGQQLAGAMQQIGAALSPVLDLFRGLWLTFGEGKQALDLVASALVEMFGPETTDLIFTVVDAIGEAITIAGPLADEFAGTLPSALESFNVAFGAAGDYVAAVMPAILAVVMAIAGQLLTFWQENGAEILRFAQQTWRTIAEIVKTAIELIKAIVVPALTAIAGFIQAHGTEIQAVLRGAWDMIRGIVSAALAIIQGVIKAALAAVKGDWSGAWAALKEAAKGALEGVETAVRGALSVISNTIGSLIEGLANKGKEIGTGIIDGIKNGISNGIEAIKRAARDAAQAALDAAKDFLGIESPSTVFRAEVGGNLAAGMALGITDGIPVVER
ncbi:MAG TPA: tape measure protein, partial [Alphaproteobacteria bacterium]|nr:tape measure protein [Alphaproteobacteria bacterium]